MDIPSPRDLGFIDKFDHWRPGQELLIDEILSDRTRTTEECSPTGSGKTAAYMGAALLSKKNTCIVTQSKGLQDQALLEFGNLGLVDLRGAANYDCDWRSDYTCEDGAAASCPYAGTPGCPRSKAELTASVSPLVITNYDKWIASGRGVNSCLSHIEQVVFDEAHHAPLALAKAMQITIHDHEAQDILGLDFPDHDIEEIYGWVEWCKIAREIAIQLKEEYQYKLNETGRVSYARMVTHMRNLSKNLSTLIMATPSNWVVEQVEKGFQFDPISPARYGESAIFFRKPKIVLISATIRPKTGYMLGVSKANLTFHEHPAVFDPRRAPTWWIPTMRVDSRTSHDMRQVWRQADKVASKRRDRNALVHTISYDRQQAYLNHSRYSDSIIYNKQGENDTDRVLEQFRQTYPGALLVSPSYGTGYDFPYKQCEFQIIAKVPFMDSRSKIVKTRQELDKEYGPYHAMQGLVQMAGRGMRHEDDRCETFILDDQCEWFIPKYAHLAPKNFATERNEHGLTFYDRLDFIPDPPERLP